MAKTYEESMKQLTSEPHRTLLLSDGFKSLALYTWIYMRDNPRMMYEATHHDDGTTLRTDDLRRALAFIGIYEMKVSHYATVYVGKEKVAEFHDHLTTGEARRVATHWAECVFPDPIWRIEEGEERIRVEPGE